MEDERPDNAADLCKYLLSELIYTTLQISGFSISLTRVRMILENTYSSPEEDVRVVKNLQSAYKFVISSLDRDMNLTLLEEAGFWLRHQPLIDLEGINEIEDPVYQAIEVFVRIIRGGYEYLVAATIAANWVSMLGCYFFPMKPGPISTLY